MHISMEVITNLSDPITNYLKKIRLILKIDINGHLSFNHNPCSNDRSNKVASITGNWKERCQRKGKSTDESAESCFPQIENFSALGSSRHKTFEAWHFATCILLHRTPEQVAGRRRRRGSSSNRQSSLFDRQHQSTRKKHRVFTASRRKLYHDDKVGRLICFVVISRI